MSCDDWIGWDVETSLTTSRDVRRPLICVQRAGQGDYEGPAPDGRLTRVESMAGGWASIHVGMHALIVGASILTTKRTHVAHRCEFDLTTTANDLGMWRELCDNLPHHGAPGPFRCTSVRETLKRISTGEIQLDHRKHFSLGSLVEEYLGFKFEEKYGPDRWQLRYQELYGVPLSEWPYDAIQYALLDAVYVRDVAIEQERYARGAWFPEINEHLCNDRGEFVNETEQIRAAVDLQIAAGEGFHLNPERGAACVASWYAEGARAIEIGESRDNPERSFIRVAGRDKGKPGSVDKKRLSAQVAAGYAAKGEQPPMTAGGKKPRKNGTLAPKQVQCDEAALIGCGVPHLSEYAEGKVYATHLSKFEGLLTDPLGGRVTYRVTPCLSTGRVSVEKPPFQQPPKKGGFRECWTVAPGYVLVSIDYAQIELVCLAWICHTMGFGSTMYDLINDGKDLHLHMATALLNAARTPAPGGGVWTYEKTEAQYKAGNEVASNARTAAKPANFGLGGGMGPDSYMVSAKGYGLEITRAEAVDQIAVYKEAYPEMVEYFAWVSTLTEAGDTTIAQFVSGRIRGGCRYTQVCNTFFQGLAADGMKRALAAITDASYDPSHPAYGVRVCLTLHDELLLAVPEDRLTTVADACAELVRSKMGEVVPGIRVKAEPEAMEYWSKDAKPLRDPKGNLLVWRP